MLSLVELRERVSDSEKAKARATVLLTSALKYLLNLQYPSILFLEPYCSYRCVNRIRSTGPSRHRGILLNTVGETERLKMFALAGLASRSSWSDAA
jgi:hypothetical protein